MVGGGGDVTCINIITDGAGSGSSGVVKKMKNLKLVKTEIRMDGICGAGGGWGGEVDGIKLKKRGIYVSYIYVSYL